MREKEITNDKKVKQKKTSTKRKVTKKKSKTKIIKKKTPEKKSRKDHWNSTWDSDKRNEFIELIKRDITFVSASAYVQLPERTVRDWLERDNKLSQEYNRARNYMNVISSNTITSAMMDKWSTWSERAKRAFEWKKRRDNRYKDKSENENTNKNIDAEVSLEKINKALWK